MPNIRDRKNYYVKYSSSYFSEAKGQYAEWVNDLNWTDEWLTLPCDISEVPTSPLDTESDNRQVFHGPP
jgi:hypothetical protein